MSDQQILLTGVGLYLLGMLVIGVVAARRVGSADEFVVAGRRLPLWLCSSTLVATWMSAGTVMGAAGAAYEDGFLGVIAVPFAAALVLVLVGLFFARMLRRLRLLTVVGFFKSRYGDTAGMLAAVAICTTNVGWAGAQLLAFGYILHALVGISTTMGVLIATVIVLIYTAAGGMWAVALTDFAQVLILTAGLVLLLPIVISDLGGVGVVMAALPEGSFRLIPRQHDLGSWLHYVRAWAIVGLGSLPSQNILQRTLSSRDESVAQNAAYLAAIGYLTIGMIPVFLGMAGAIALPGLLDPELVVPELAMRYLHPVAMAIFCRGAAVRDHEQRRQRVAVTGEHRRFGRRALLLSRGQRSDTFDDGTSCGSCIRFHGARDCALCADDLLADARCCLDHPGVYGGAVDRWDLVVEGKSLRHPYRHDRRSHDLAR